MATETSWTKDYWYSPHYVFMKYDVLLTMPGVDAEKIQTEGRFKRVREMLAGANFALIIQKAMGQCAHVQLDASEKVDFYLILADHEVGKISDVNISQFQHTAHEVSQYRKLNISDQIAATKLKTNDKGSIDENYGLLVETRGFGLADIKQVKSTLRKHKIGYKVFLMKGQYEKNDATGEVAAFNVFFEGSKVSFKEELERYPLKNNPWFFYINRSVKDTSFKNPTNADQPWPWGDIKGIDPKFTKST